MTTPFIATLPTVEPVVEMGVGTTNNPTGTALWNRAHWSRASDAKWSGEQPAWFDISCYVQDVQTFCGRERAGEPFEIGTATIVADNTSGWADYTSPGSPATETLLSVRPGRPIRVGVRLAGGPPQWLFRGYADQVNPSFTPNVGPTVVFECVDAKGDVGRTELVKLATPVGAGEQAHVRVSRILNAVPWSLQGALRSIQASGVTLIATTMEGQVADLLDQAADSSGGVVFGDLQGRVAYRPRDWQTFDIDAEPEGTLSNVGGFGTGPSVTTLVPLVESPAGSGLYDVAGVIESPADSDLYRPAGDEMLVGEAAYELYTVANPGDVTPDVCPAGWEITNAREDIATRTLVGRNGDDASVITLNDAGGQSMFGVETQAKLDLDTQTSGELLNLATRWARIRSWKTLPRLTAHVAADERQPASLVMLAGASPFKPSLLRCIHVEGDRTVFSRLMFVAGIEHALAPDGWTARLLLDSANPWVSEGGRWGTTAKWSNAANPNTTWQPAA